MVHLTATHSNPSLVSRGCMAQKKKPNPKTKLAVFFRHKWQHAVWVNVLRHKSGMTLAKAPSSAWWRSCAAHPNCLQQPAAVLLSFRSHCTTWKRLWSRVNIVITWFTPEILLCTGSVESMVENSFIMSCDAATARLKTNLFGRCLWGFDLMALKSFWKKSCFLGGVFLAWQRVGAMFRGHISSGKVPVQTPRPKKSFKLIGNTKF